MTPNDESFVTGSSNVENKAVDEGIVDNDASSWTTLLDAKKAVGPTKPTAAVREDNKGQIQFHRTSNINGYWRIFHADNANITNFPNSTRRVRVTEPGNNCVNERKIPFRLRGSLIQRNPRLHSFMTTVHSTSQWMSTTLFSQAIHLGVEWRCLHRGRYAIQCYIIISTEFYHSSSEWPFVTTNSEHRAYERYTRQQRETYPSMWKHWPRKRGRRTPPRNSALPTWCR